MVLSSPSSERAAERIGWGGLQYPYNLFSICMCCMILTAAVLAMSYLQQHPNVIFCGDMNWDDKLDGRFPFTEGWFDAWEKLRPGEVGYTYDTKTNKMLIGDRTLQKRLDRFICHLPDFEICSIDIIGTEAIPGLTYTKDKKVRGETKKHELPVLPSDHGLLLTITSK